MMENEWIVFEGEKGINRFFKGNRHITEEALVPFSSNSDQKEYTDFSGVTGAFSRMLSGVAREEDMDYEQIKSRIREKISECEEEDLEVLFQIIQNIYFEDRKLLPVNIKALNFIGSNETEEKIARYLYGLFVEDSELVEKYRAMVELEDSNLLEKLLFDSLESREKTGQEKGNPAVCFLPQVKDLFHTDFQTLLDEPELYQKYIVRFLAYYYMFYVVQLVVKLSKFEKGKREEIEPVYMTLYHETVTRIRPGYEYGWKYVKEKMHCLFSHSIVLKMLSCNVDEQHVDYIDMYDRFCGKPEDADTARQIAQIREQYQQWVQADYSGYRHDPARDGDCETSNEIRKLFERIDYQFTVSGSSRKSNYGKYAQRFEGFVKKNFCKFRGPCGDVFSLQDSDIIMFTRIILLEREGKIRLDRLFEEFERRGLLFDRESKKKIIGLYEKMNLLEKRSDSGEAQYVKYIL